MLGFLTRTPKRIEQDVNWALRRRDELRALLENLDVALDDAQEKLQRFHFENCVFNGRRLVYVSNSLFNRTQLEQLERDLILRIEQVQRDRSSTMAELVSLKE